MSWNLSRYFLDSKGYNFHEETFFKFWTLGSQNEHAIHCTNETPNWKFLCSFQQFFLPWNQTHKSQIFHKSYLDLYKNARELFWHNKELKRWRISPLNWKNIKNPVLKMQSPFLILSSSIFSHSSSSLFIFSFQTWGLFWTKMACRRLRSQHLLSCINC